MSRMWIEVRHSVVFDEADGTEDEQTEPEPTAPPAFGSAASLSLREPLKPDETTSRIYHPAR